MERTQLGGFASIIEAAKPHPTIEGAVTIQMADWAARELAKLLRALEIVHAVCGQDY